MAINLGLGTTFNGIHSDHNISAVFERLKIS